IAFNLMNEVDVAETEAKIAAYEMENKESIAANQAKLLNEQRYRNYQDELEKKEREQKREEYLKQLEEERKMKEIEKSDIITELATSNKSAQAVIQARQATALKRSSALRQQQQQQQQQTDNKLFIPSWITTAMEADVDMRENEARNFDPLALQYEYTSGYTVRENYMDSSTEYIHNNKQVKAGGYQAKFAHQRALMASFTGILCQPVE
ncbi:CDK-activating kinase assembly factor MAT1-domain-containing protein, partial [Cokeromyces recurvatus]|uniref:CDK-activating kinase assembly factor MAT1-domain-containing protein n=1 Tax=Cokeromyces recurvatus TaxID=90255 RepID=UPI00221E8CE5